MKPAIKKVALGLGIVVAVYFALLLILSFVLEGVVERRIQERLSATFHSEKVKIEDVSVSLLRGHIALRGVQAERRADLVGAARIELEEVSVEIAGWGWAIFDSDPISARVVGAKLHFSAAGIGTMKAPEEGAPIELSSLEIVDSSITVVLSDYLPSIGRSSLKVERAQANSVVLSSSTSWLSGLESLQAQLEIPGDTTVGVGYQEGKLHLSGSVLGSDPVSFPFAIPVADPRELEWKHLLSVAKELAVKLAPILARRKAEELWERVAD